MMKTLSKKKKRKLLFLSLVSPIVAGFILLLVLLTVTPSLQRINLDSNKRLIQADIQRSMDFLFAEAIKPSFRPGTNHLPPQSIKPLSNFDLNKCHIQLVKTLLSEESSNNILVEMEIKISKNNLIIYEQTRYASYSK
ncbi:MAG: hypothetical protein L7U87_04360 [Chlamydiales bacterium]|nr:hypothetical protein [Chlamydiales bacterium]